MVVSKCGLIFVGRCKNIEYRYDDYDKQKTIESVSTKRQKTEPKSDNEENLDVEASILFQKEDIVQHIVSLVGTNQYRFVAAINSDFKAAYLQLFPSNTKPYINGSTRKHAEISIESRYYDDPGGRATVLCDAVVRHGDVATLQYLLGSSCMLFGGKI
jgi:hypothetical protein